MNRFWSANATLALSTLTWGIAPVAIRFLSEDYPPYTQAFFRYLCASLSLVLYSLFFCRKETRTALRAWRPLLLVAAFNVGGMIAWTHGCYLETATVAQLVTKIYLPIVVLVSFIVFHDERRVIRSPKFGLGCALGLIGVVMVLIQNPNEAYVSHFSKGTLILVGATFFWAGYNVLAKHVVTGLHPISLFTVVCVFSTLALGVFCLVLEWPIRLFPATPTVTLIAILSGIVPIGIGHCAFHYSQKYLGAAYCGSLLLLTPFVSNGIAVFIWEDEVMTWIQWFGAFVLISGSYLVIQAGHKNRLSAPEYREVEKPLRHGTQ